MDDSGLDKEGLGYKKWIAFGLFAFVLIGFLFLYSETTENREFTKKYCLSLLSKDYPSVENVYINMSYGGPRIGRGEVGKYEIFVYYKNKSVVRKCSLSFNGKTEFEKQYDCGNTMVSFLFADKGNFLSSKISQGGKSYVSYYNPKFLEEFMDRRNTLSKIDDYCEAVE